MKTAALLVLALVLLPGSGLAQKREQGGDKSHPAKQTLDGKVVEDSTHVPIAGASVTVLDTSGVALKGAVTDSAGAFQLAFDTAGVYRLRAEQPGYRTVTSDTVSVEKDEFVTVELRLARQAIPLEPLVVTARVDRRISAFYERVRNNGWGRYLTRADIEHRIGQRPTELIRLMSGVRIISVTPCRNCRPEDVIYLRGSGPGGSNVCSPTVFIDGMEVKQDALSPINDVLLTDNLEGVEVYTDPGTEPPEFISTSSTCGVVAFWTRPATGQMSWKKLLLAVGIAVVLLFAALR